MARKPFNFNEVPIDKKTEIPFTFFNINDTKILHLPTFKFKLNLLKVYIRQISPHPVENVATANLRAMMVIITVSC